MREIWLPKLRKKGVRMPRGIRDSREKAQNARRARDVFYYRGLEVRGARPWSGLATDSRFID